MPLKTPEQRNSLAAHAAAEARYFTAASAQAPADLEERRRVQADLAAAIKQVAIILELDVADSREKVTALTHLDAALLFGGKAVFA
jgi:hypothetical protein